MAQVKITKRTPYAVLELNQVAFRRDGRIEAQCKLNATDFATVPAENGMLLALDNVKREVKLPSANATDVVLNYSAEHMYDERKPGLGEFCLKPGEFLPRLGYLAKGDKFTTNAVEYDDSTYNAESAFWTAVAGVGTTALYGHASADGYITVNATAANSVLKVVKGFDLPNGDKAIQFIAL